MNRTFIEPAPVLVDALTWEAVCTMCGPDLPILIRLTQEAYCELLSTALPPALVSQPINLMHRTRGFSQVTSYSVTDPLRLPNQLVDLLPSFDGRPLEEVRRALAAEQHIVLDDALLRKLLDFELLTTPPEER